MHHGGNCSLVLLTLFETGIGFELHGRFPRHIVRERVLEHNPRTTVKSKCILTSYECIYNYCKDPK